MNKLSIVFINFNGSADLRRVLKLIYPEDVDSHEIIIVDNASSESIDWIAKDYPKINTVRLHRNYGYSFAANRGYMATTGNWLLFMNPDVQISKSTLDTLIKEAESRGLDAASPRTAGHDYQKPSPSGLSILAEFTPLSHIIPLSLFRNKTLFGGCLLIRKSVVMELGGWDERYFLWFEDSDLTRRLYGAGYKVGWIDVPIQHVGGASLKKLSRDIQRKIFFHSLRLYAKTHMGPVDRWIVNCVSARFANNILLPNMTDGVSITVPNIRRGVLDSFLAENDKYLVNCEEEIIISTSSVKEREIWNYRSKYPDIRFIPLTTNHGFASTVNIGFEASTGAWCGTVNDDAVLSSGWIEKIMECANEQVGSLNPIINNTNGEIESAGIEILSIGKARAIKNVQHGATCIGVDATNGAAVLYQKSILDVVGIFDTRFGSYLEDIDLSLRIARAGYANVVSTSATIIHKKHGSSTMLGRNKSYLDFKNWILVISKNWRMETYIIWGPLIIIERLRNLWGIVKQYNK